MSKRFNFKVEVEHPFPDSRIETLSLDDAQRRFNLDPWDLETLAEDRVLFINEVALSKSEEL